MKEFYYNEKTFQNEIEIEETSDGSVFTLLEVTDGKGTPGWAVRETNYSDEKVINEEITYPRQVYDRSDFKTEKDVIIVTELFDCIFYTDNGITNYLDFGEEGVCEQNEELTYEDFEDFLARYPLFKYSILLECEESLGVTISFLLFLDSNDMFKMMDERLGYENN